MKTVFVLTLCLFSVSALAEKAAMVKLLKGDVYSISGGKKVKLKANDWIEEGSVVKTEQKSFVRLVFLDKSLMNVSPSSELKIERFDKKDAGVLGLIKGKIRSQVTKDYLQIQGKDRSKLFIKTSNAVMGIRGTDFLITTNGRNTAAILFEGEVVFNRLTDARLVDSQKLDSIVDSGVRLFPGEFSAVGMGAPTIPALLNVNQRVILEKDKAVSDNNGKQKSIVPPGLAANNVLNKPSVIRQDPDRQSAKAESYVLNGQIKPVNGSLVDLENAVIVAPGADATYDQTTNTYVNKDTTLNVASPVFSGDISTVTTSTSTGSTDENAKTTTTSDTLKSYGTTYQSSTSTQSEQIVYTAEDYKISTGSDYFSKDSTTTGGTTTGGTTTGGTTGGGLEAVDPNGGTTTGLTTTGGTSTGGTSTGGTSTGGTTTGPNTQLDPASI